MKKPEMTFYYRGHIEQGTGRPGYAWRDGYSRNSADGRPLYPWSTYRECQREAAAAGCRAIFIRAN